MGSDAVGRGRLLSAHSLGSLMHGDLHKDASVHSLGTCCRMAVLQHQATGFATDTGAPLLEIIRDEE